MPKVSGSVTLWFDNIEFDDEGDLSIRDQAHEALTMEARGGDVIDVVIDTIEDATERTPKDTGQ
jgi:hypothetical protein